MAEYIDDSGIYNKDALFVGVEDTAWSKNATDRAIWFSSTGTCTTGFTLPDSEFIVYEVYGMTGTSLTADYTTLTGSTKLQGKKDFTTTIGTILTTLNAWRTALDKTNYTTYDIIATHYKGSDLADVYEADETVAFTTATTTDGTFTGHGSEWVISDALLSASVGVFDILDPFNDSSAIHYYDMENDSVDNIGTLDGTDTNMTYSTGKNGVSADFDGTADIEMASRFLAPASFSVSLWAKRTSTGNGWIVANRSGSGTTDQEWQISLHSSSTYLGAGIRTDTAGGTWFDTFSTTLDYASTFDWSYITLTVDDDGGGTGGTIKLYVDAILEDTTAYTGTRYTGASFGAFGKLWSGSYYFTGSVDDAHIFNKALTLTEIEYLFENTGGTL